MCGPNGVETCGYCWGMYRHADICPVGKRLKETAHAAANEDARKKHLADIEFLNQNARGNEKRA